MNRICLFITFCFLAIGGGLAEDVRQETKGNCSPAVMHVKGTVIVNCPGITPEAQKVLNSLLHEVKGLEQKLNAANEWAERYHDVETRLAAQGDNKVLSQQAAKMLKSGDLEGAARLFDRVIQQQQKDVGDLAETLFNRAQISSLQFLPKEALVYLEQAYRYAPQNSEYAHEYASVLSREGRWTEAEQVLTGQIKRLENQDPSENTSEYLARALNNLGTFQAESLRLEDAERSLAKAESIYRTLVIQNPTKFRRFLATTLSNKAGLEARTFRNNEADKDFSESIAILESILGDPQLEILKASQDKQKTAATLVGSFNNLTFLYVHQKEFIKAEETINEALSLVRILVDLDPKRYGEELVSTLLNISEVQIASGKLSFAQKTNSEALANARAMAADDPDASNVLLARALITTSILMKFRGELSSAESSSKEALGLYAKMRSLDPRRYVPEQSLTLLILAEVCLLSARPAEAKAYYEDALVLARDASIKAPKAEQLRFATVLHDSAVYDLAAGQFDSARLRMAEVVPLLRSLSVHNSDLMPLLGESLNVLGGLEMTAGHLSEAGREFQEAVAIEYPLVAKDLIRYGGVLAQIHHNLGAYWRVKGNDWEAELCFYRALDIDRQMASLNPELQLQVVLSLAALSSLYRSQARWVLADTVLQETIAICRRLERTPFDLIVLAEQLEILAAVRTMSGNPRDGDLLIEEGLQLYTNVAANDQNSRDAVSGSMAAIADVFGDGPTKCKLLRAARNIAIDSSVAGSIDTLLKNCN